MRLAVFEGFNGIEQESYSGLDDAVLNVLDRAVKGVRVQTTLGPDLYIPDPFRTDPKTTGDGGAAPGAAGAAGLDPLRLLKPKITLYTHDGWGRDRVFAPYGDPGGTLWPWIVFTGFVTVGLAVVGGVSLAKRARR
jgi:hypothetical protein